MPHNLRSTELGCRQRSKHMSTAASSSLNVAKKRLCVAMRRASFHTRSIGANCGLYGGRNSKLSTVRYFRNKGLEKYGVVVPGVVQDDNHALAARAMPQKLLQKVSNVTASNLSHMVRMNLPVLRPTAPKQATDLRWGRASTPGP